MSVDAHWYSTLYAWYTMASWFLGGISMLILVLIYLKSKGYLAEVTTEHLHDLGKYMFGISIFWTYCWFSQYMLIWYGNVGEETIYFRERLDHYPVLFYGNLVINFALPFLILMRNTTKRRVGTLVFTSIVVFFGHWFDFFYLIKPGTLITAKEHIGHVAAEGGHEAASHASGFVTGFTFPGLFEVGIMLGFLAFFLFWVFRQLEKAPLIAQNDPYLQESLHHEVQPYE
jgi:Ni/Fe-hydrogenase subunit HybB-like protein